MKYAELMALFIAMNPTAAAACAGMSFADLKREYTEEVLKTKINAAVAAGAVVPEDDAAEEYERFIAQILQDAGISFVGSAGDFFDALVETQVQNNGSNAGDKSPFIKIGENEFKLAGARNEKTFTAVVKFISFDRLKDGKKKDGSTYATLLATCVVYDAKGNGTQKNYTVNGPLLAAMRANGVFKGVAIDKEGVPSLEEGQEIYALVQLSEKVKGVTTWGSDDAAVIARAGVAGTLVYTVKGKKFAAVLDRQDSVQDSLDKIVGVVDPSTINRLKEGQMTRLEFIKAEALIGSEIGGTKLQNLLKNAEKLQETIAKLVDAGMDAATAKEMATKALGL